jgi:hypothetical protein
MCAAARRLRLVDQGGVHVGGHVVGHVRLDSVDLRVGVAIDRLTHLVGRLLVPDAGARRIDTRAIQRDAILFVAQLDDFRLLLLVDLAKAHGGGDPVVRVHPQAPDEILSCRHGFRLILDVGVGVDHAWHHRLAGKVHPRGACGNLHRGGRAGRRDAAVADENGALLDRSAAGAVDDPHTCQCRDAALRRLGGRSLENDAARDEDTHCDNNSQATQGAKHNQPPCTASRDGAGVRQAEKRNLPAIINQQTMPAPRNSGVSSYSPRCNSSILTPHGSSANDIRTGENAPGGPGFGSVVNVRPPFAFSSVAFVRRSDIRQPT